MNTQNAISATPDLAAEQLTSLSAAIPRSLLANTLLSGLLLLVQWEVVQGTLALTWLGLMLAVLVVRAVIYADYRRSRPLDAAQTVRMLRRYRIGILATGMVWGMVPLIMFPSGDAVHQVFLAFVIAGVCAGATASLSVDRISNLGFIVPPLVTLMVAFLSEHGAMPVVMAGMVAMYMLFVVQSSIQSHRQFHDNLRLRNEALAQESVLQQQKRLVDVIARAQSQFIREDDRRRAFDGLLQDLLSLTDSEYGFIGEVLRTSAGQPYLKTYAISNIAWDDVTRAFYQEHAPQGMEFFNLNTLFGTALSSGEPVIVNDPDHDPRRAGLPEGHPALNAFLGVPIKHGGALVAMIGIANRPGGYHQGLIDDLQPLLITIGQLVEAAEIKQRETDSQARIADQAQHTQAILNNMVDGVITIDVQGVIQTFNLAAERVFGYAAEEVVGRNVKMLMPSPYHEHHDDYLKNYQLTHQEKVIGNGREVEGLRQDGSQFPMELAVSEIRREGHPIYVGIVRDITERKRVECMKNEFVSTVSHELRTPLTSISGALGLIAGGALGDLPEKVREMILIALNNSQRLSHLINDLLDMEKLMAGKMRIQLQPQRLAPMLTEAMSDNQGYADKYQVLLALAPVPDVLVHVDAQRLQQVLSNLISNAIKFSPIGGQVEISAQVMDNQVRVAVRDHGAGIPPEFRERIFQKFAQADASNTRQRGGTGLGLAISRELIEHMAGKIGFDSAEGKGSCFYIDLPL